MLLIILVGVPVGVKGLRMVVVLLLILFGLVLGALSVGGGVGEGGFVEVEDCVLELAEGEGLLKAEGLYPFEEGVAAAGDDDIVEYVEDGGDRNDKHGDEQQDIDELVLAPELVEPVDQNGLSQLLAVEDYPRILLLHQSRILLSSQLSLFIC